MGRWRKTHMGEGPQLADQSVNMGLGEIEDWYAYPNGWGVHAVIGFGSGLLRAGVTARLVVLNPHHIRPDAPGWPPGTVPEAPKWAGAWFGKDGFVPVELNMSGLGMLCAAVAALDPRADDE
jgi:hypothetical protein